MFEHQTLATWVSGMETDGWAEGISRADAPDFFFDPHNGGEAWGVAKGLAQVHRSSGPWLWPIVNWEVAKAGQRSPFEGLCQKEFPEGT